MMQRELSKILRNHKHWLSEDCKDWENMRAHLREADLSGMDLRGADLRNADLRGANLSGANLCKANLFETDLREANLSKADLRKACLYGADLFEADLHKADLSEADLCRACFLLANLSGANLCGADLFKANLFEADLCRANLCTTNLYKADLSGADLREVDLYNADLCEVGLFNAKLFTADNIPFFPCACPDFGIFIGYKTAHEYIVELEIPEDAKRVSATTRRCRCNKAKVLRILNRDRTVADITEVRSDYDSSFVYKVGEIVSVDNFNEDRWDECSTGIHFFINFQEAVKTIVNKEEYL